MAELAAFLGVAVLVIVTPGQDTALTIRNTLLGGGTGGVFTAIGVAAGQATWTLVTSLGIGALLAASQSQFFGLKLAGSAYLVFLGAHTILGVLRSRHQAEAAVVGRSGTRLAERLHPRRRQGKRTAQAAARKPRAGRADGDRPRGAGPAPGGGARLAMIWLRVDGKAEQQLVQLAVTGGRYSRGRW